MQLVTALWAVLALVYVSLALFTRKDSENSEKKYIRVATADERLKDIFAEDASCISEKITKHHVYFPDHRINKHDEDKR